jgi:SAM-dependent methyltransferase
MLQGVKRTGAGLSIYEDATPVFFGDEQADYYRDETAIDAARTKLAWVQRFVPPGGKLLDVGANFGLFAREAARGYDTLGIEPSAAVVARAREEFGAPLVQGSIDADEPAYAAAFDAVTLFDVLEHLSDPGQALERCHRYLKPGGHLFITTPDIGSVMARLLGRHWYYVDMDEHIALFTTGGLRQLLERAGFTVVEAGTTGRRYRLSYIERRLRFLSRQGGLLRAASVAARPLRLWGNAQVALNLGDVMALTARSR